MIGYTKLFETILTSTVWQEDDPTRIVWITMLALKNSQDIVESSVPGLAHLARVSLEQCEAALQKFSQPDPYSRSAEHEGRRIAQVEGGWKILNGAKYRQKMDEAGRREYFRVKQQQYRQRGRPNNPTPGKPLSGEAAYQQALERGASEEELERITDPEESLAARREISGGGA